MEMCRTIIYSVKDLASWSKEKNEVVITAAVKNVIFIGGVYAQKERRPNSELRPRPEAPWPAEPWPVTCSPSPNAPPARAWRFIEACLTL